MTKFIEPSKELNVLADAEVVVLGGGPGGIPAAVASARAGHKTVIVERYGVLGGLATGCLMGPFFGYLPVEGRYSRGQGKGDQCFRACQRGDTTQYETEATLEEGHEFDELILGGIPIELVRRLQAYGGAFDDDNIEWDAIRFDPELFKFVCDDICVESGVKVILHAWAVGTIVEDNKIKAVIVESKSGRQVITGKIFIDATGDADVAAFAGVPFNKGRKADGLTSSMGTRFRIGNVRDRTDEEIIRGHEIITQGIIDGEIHPRSTNWSDEIGSTIRPNEVSPDTTRAAGDGTNVMHLTHAELKIRKDTRDIMKFLKEKVPGFENAFLMDSPFCMGVRETRQIVGEYQLSDDDVLNVRKHDDGIAKGCWWVDIHCPLGNIVPWDATGSLCTEICRVEEYQGKPCIMKSKYRDQLPPRPFLNAGEHFDIPYGCVVPKKIDNLLVSGRCISATHMAMNSSRVIGTCFAVGEACGEAAAMALDKDLTPRELDVQELRGRLKKNGCIV